MPSTRSGDEAVTHPRPAPGVDEIMARIRAEAVRRRQAEAGMRVGRPASPDAEPFPAKRKYALDDFLRLGDERFVRGAYQGLLRRHPDPADLAADLEGLRSGRTAKVDLLIGLRWSPEGRRLGVKISGLERLRRIRRLQRLPVLGPVIDCAAMLVRLPGLGRRMRALEARHGQAMALLEEKGDVPALRGEPEAAAGPARGSHPDRGA